MTDKEFDLMMQHNPHLRITQEDGGRASVAAQIAQAHAAITAQLAENALPSEDDMQIAVIQWADAQPHPALRWLFHVPNGGARDAATGGKLKAMGVRAGVVDLLLPWHDWDGQAARYVGLAIEMKRKPNRPSAEQREWLAHLESQGWRCEVCWSAEEAIGVLREYLDIA